jgi:hypothetical protein
VSFIDVISDLSTEYKLLKEFEIEELGKYFDSRVMMEVQMEL